VPLIVLRSSPLGRVARVRANLGIVYKARTIDVCVDAVIERSGMRRKVPEDEAEATSGADDGGGRGRSGMTEPEAHDEMVRNAVNTGVT
jgi:hypothetical protein